jgi:acyl-lipid omega-6 desaturase (Delta-12 desaturase)
MTVSNGLSRVDIQQATPASDALVAEALQPLRGTVPEAKMSDHKIIARRLAAHCNRYKGGESRHAITQMVTTLVPLALVITLMVLTVDQLYVATLLLALPAAGLLIRVFIIQHDCGHGSFFADKRLNESVGRIMSLLTVTPYGLWRREHAQHHAGSGNLDRRGVGDIDTKTVAEYEALSPLQKLIYRVYRHPLFLFGFGVPFYFLILHRLPWGHALSPRDNWKSIAGLNAALVAVYGPVVWLVGIVPFVKIALPMLLLSTAIGGWLFFMQHQFEETHWDEAKQWDFQVAAIFGSSFYVLPKWLQWFTGNIGLHHIHHLCSMIPNYKLQACLDSSPELSAMNRLTLWESFACARLTLWDEANRRMIGFREFQRMTRERFAGPADHRH